MSNHEYILIFVFAGLAWLGLSVLSLGVFMGIRRLVTPKPKPTAYEKQWEQIMEDLRR